MKDRLDDPLIVLTGDLNRRDISPAIADFPDLIKISTGATRGSATLDVTYTNFNGLISETNTLPPHESNDGNSVSDHNIVHVALAKPVSHHFVKRSFTFRPITEHGKTKFKRELLACDWESIRGKDSSQSAEKLCALLDYLTNICFPEKTRTVKNCDKPWMTRQIKLLTRRKRREYAKKRRSTKWRLLNTETEALIKAARLKFFNKMKKQAKESKNSRQFFRAIDVLKKKDETWSPWTINDLFPGHKDGEIAEKVASYFNRIGDEYEPLPADYPATDCSQLCPQMYEIAAAIRHIRKPKSMVPGDIPPDIVTELADIIAIPLHIIFSQSYKSSQWPKLWQQETVTVISKVTRPTSLSQLRNLSCTPLFSKIMESFVLKQLRSEVTLRPTQFGGLKGTSVDHFLIETWQRILQILEDDRAATTIASIDFEKAFNRMCHGECLKAAKKGELQIKPWPWSVPS